MYDSGAEPHRSIDAVPEPVSFVPASSTLVHATTTARSPAFSWPAAGPGRRHQQQQLSTPSDRQAS